MNEYTASNGVIVRPRPNELRFSTCGAGDWSAFETAVWEYLRAKRDEELGRWRWNDYVVYPQEDGSVRAVDERSGITDLLYRGGDERNPLLATAGGSDAARAYFAAHPVVAKQPWHDAKPGEVWVLTVDGEEVVAIPMSDGTPDFYFTRVVRSRYGISFDKESITAGRRIWPEGD